MDTTEKKSMTVKEAASQMGKAQGFVRAGLRFGILPFGVAVKLHPRYCYV